MRDILRFECHKDILFSAFMVPYDNYLKSAMGSQKFSKQNKFWCIIFLKNTPIALFEKGCYESKVLVQCPSYQENWEHLTQAMGKGWTNTKQRSVHCVEMVTEMELWEWYILQVGCDCLELYFSILCVWKVIYTYRDKSGLWGAGQFMASTNCWCCWMKGEEDASVLGLGSHRMQLRRSFWDAK